MEYKNLKNKLDKVEIASDFAHKFFIVLCFIAKGAEIDEYKHHMSLLDFYTDQNTMMMAGSIHLLQKLGIISHIDMDEGIIEINKNSSVLQGFIEDNIADDFFGIEPENDAMEFNIERSDVDSIIKELFEL